MSRTLTLYSRLGCHLCEDMAAQLPAYLDGTDIVLETCYLDQHPELEARYGDKVPVLKAGDREICHYFLDANALQQYISNGENPVN